MIFAHHGDYGDIVYSLMAVKRLCDEAQTSCTFYLCPAADTRARLTPDHAEGILPLLRAQSYIARAEWREKSIGVKADVSQRRFYANGFNIADQLCNWLAIPYSVEHGPWLAAEPNPVAEVIFSRSHRYRNPRFPWKEVCRRFGGQARFVGTPAEHADFEALVGPIHIVPTPTLLDVAQAIAGCKLFVGNQSCPRAIAEGLKVPVVVEQDHKCANTHFARPDAWYDQLPPPTFKVT